MTIESGNNLNSINPFDLLAGLQDSPTKLDKKLRAKVLALIAKLGKSVVFVIQPQKDYDPTKGEATGLDPIYPIKKIIPPFEYESKYIDGDLIKVGDMQSGIAAKDLEFTPAKSMTVCFDDMTWKIIRVMPIYTGQQIALYMFQLRR
ncbi:MAG TPA: hypothetical protein DDW84_01445 [Phycisphaerales bacterium]|nr:MAG: hypothetical protein A2Y13_01240 [Planctomycetes bacterium GWC2_45_44]HBG77501.1 hypothetical protein [Phycisphaerales bacterium]HBR19109.1 hypothetical protein [Phycisphaerales bacterium]